MPSDQGACGLYRLFWPAEVLAMARQDWQVHVVDPKDVRLKLDDHGQLRQISGLPRMTDIDLLVVQRVGTRAVLELIRHAQKHGVAVLMDNDDAMWAIAADNAAWQGWNNRAIHWKATDSAAQMVDLNTCTTPALEQRYGPRSQVIPNRVPAACLDLPRQPRDSRTAVGWAGFTNTHPHDLSVVGDGVRKAIEETGARLLALPDIVGVANGFGVNLWDVEVFGPANIGTDYFNMLQQLDIALVPLEESKFNQAKSALKALECAAMGAVVVASPSPANLALQRSGVPLLIAHTPRLWQDHITRLVNDPAECAERVARGRQVISEKWTIESRIGEWHDAWTRARQTATNLRSR